MKKLLNLAVFGLLCLLISVESGFIGNLNDGLFNELAFRSIDCEPGTCRSEQVARDYLINYYEKEASHYCHAQMLADFTYQTDITAQNLEAFQRATKNRNDFMKAEVQNVLSRFDWESFTDASTKRQFKFLSSLGPAALSNVDLLMYDQIVTNMTNLYNNAKICPFDKKDSCNLETEGLTAGGVEVVIRDSLNYDELTYVWTEWRNVAGSREMRLLFDEYLKYSQIAADADGFDNFAKYWGFRYESENVYGLVEDLWLQVKPFYLEFHAYIRHKLSLKFPGRVNGTRPIPAHLLGNMWGQSWQNLYNDVAPYPDTEPYDTTQILKNRFTSDKEGITEMFEIANAFYTDSGMPDVTKAFTDGMVVHPGDREVVCYGKVDWDMCDGNDFRVKICTEIDMLHFGLIHHELGHVQNYIQYKEQPISFRDGANPGFHEGVGNSIELSVNSAKHMEAIGLIDAGEVSDEAIVNFMMKMAMDKLAFMPLALTLDVYRWRLFDGSIPKDKFEYNWIKMRSEYQGFIPPSVRSELNFDAAGKVQIPTNVQYLRYFISYILQFQFHKAFCVAAGETGQLHNCDIYQKSGGWAKFRELTQLGNSKHWEDILMQVTGTRNLDASAFIEYFQPLIEFMQAERAQHGYSLGWDQNSFEEMYQP